MPSFRKKIRRTEGQKLQRSGFPFQAGEPDTLFGAGASGSVSKGGASIRLSGSVDCFLLKNSWLFPFCTRSGASVNSLCAVQYIVDQLDLLYRMDTVLSFTSTLHRVYSRQIKKPLNVVVQRLSDKDYYFLSGFSGATRLSMSFPISLVDFPRMAAAIVRRMDPKIPDMIPVSSFFPSGVPKR